MSTLSNTITELRQTEPGSSVELSRTAKGEVTFTVKAYAETPEDAAQLARATFDALCRSYPFGG